jgi:hypothetical protein
MIVSKHGYDDRGLTPEATTIDSPDPYRRLPSVSGLFIVNLKPLLGYVADVLALQYFLN